VADHEVMAGSAELVADEREVAGRGRRQRQDLVVPGHELEVHIYGLDGQAVIEVE